MAAGDPRKQRHCAIGWELYREWKALAQNYAAVMIQPPNKRAVGAVGASYDAYKEAHRRYVAHVDHGWKPEEADDGTQGI